MTPSNSARRSSGVYTSCRERPDLYTSCHELLGVYTSCRELPDLYTSCRELLGVYTCHELLACTPNHSRPKQRRTADGPIRTETNYEQIAASESALTYRSHHRRRDSGQVGRGHVRDPATRR